MSETLPNQQGEGAPPETGPSVEDRARLMGWRPKHEFKGDAERWLPAEDFLNRAFELPGVLADRYNKLEKEFGRQSSELTQLRQQFGDATSTISEMTTMLRTTEQRSYERAKRELEREIAEARTNGDFEAFQRATDERAELERTAPRQQPNSGTPTQGGPQQGNGQGAPFPQRQRTPQELQAENAFRARNTWYGSNPMLTVESDAAFNLLMVTRPDLSHEQKLGELERRMRALFPAETGGTQASATQQGNSGGGNEGGGAAAVTGQGEGGAGPRREPARKRDFNTMPSDAKAAYRKYKAQLAGKGEPLTEAEYARYYWEQFPDDEAA